MDMSFNADEVFEMAMEAERSGARFYRKAAENATNEETKKTLQKFAAMEDEHELIFKNLKKEFEAIANDDNTVYDPDGVGAAYLQAIADANSWEGKVSPDQELTGSETFQEVLTIALNSEKEAVTFYAGLRELVSKLEGKKKVDAIICEEMSHVAQLTNMLNDLRS